MCYRTLIRQGQFWLCEMRDRLVEYAPIQNLTALWLWIYVCFSQHMHIQYALSQARWQRRTNGSVVLGPQHGQGPELSRWGPEVGIEKRERSRDGQCSNHGAQNTINPAGDGGQGLLGPAIYTFVFLYGLSWRKHTKSLLISRLKKCG